MTTYEKRRNVDKEWFQARLDERQISMRGLAKLMEVDPSTVSLMMRGLRGLSMENAIKMAQHLNCTTNELYKRAGLPIQDEARSIEISMYTDNKGGVHGIDPAARDRISAPYDTPTSAFAIQKRSSEFHDGWLMIVDGGHFDPARCLGSLSLFCRADGSRGTGIIRRGYKGNLYNITHNVIENPHDEADVDLVWASPVVWIKPVNPVL